MWLKVKRYLPFLKFVPFLRMVAVCNNLSFGRVNKNSDIDLFIIAKKGRLFFVRTMVTFVLHVLGVRRHGDKIAGRFCLSFFVDDSHLDLSRIAIYKDVYLAFWVQSIVPILDDGISVEFLEANVWAKDFFESAKELDYSKVVSRKNFVRKLMNGLLNGRLGDFFERNLRTWQIKRSREKMLLVKDPSHLLVEENILKFHNNDRRALYRDLWTQKYGEDAKLSRETFMTLF